MAPRVVVVAVAALAAAAGSAAACELRLEPSSVFGGTGLALGACQSRRRVAEPGPA
jgi:hypothetical protein